MVFCSIWLEMTVPKTCLNIRARNDFARQNHYIRWFHKSFRNPWNNLDLVSWDLNSVFSSFLLKRSLIEPWKQYLTLYLNDAIILTNIDFKIIAQWFWRKSVSVKIIALQYHKLKYHTNNVFPLILPVIIQELNFLFKKVTFRRSHEVLSCLTNRLGAMILTGKITAFKEIIARVEVADIGPNLRISQSRRSKTS